MRKLNPTATLLLTAGADGAFYSTSGEEGDVPAPEVEVIDTTGAGDTYIAGFVWARGKLTKSIERSVEIAVNLASQKVSQEGFQGVWRKLEEQFN